MKLRPLGIAKEIIENTGLQVTYVYDDLIFVEHSPFLIQFDDNDSKNLKLFFNVDCETDAVVKLTTQLKNAAKARDFIIQNSGKFEMKPKKGSDELEISFIN